MTTLETSIVLATGVWLIFSAFFLTPSNNFASKMFFQFVPFVLGSGCVIVALRDMGVFAT